MRGFSILIPLRATRSGRLMPPFYIWGLQVQNPTRPSKDRTSRSLPSGHVDRIKLLSLQPRPRSSEEKDNACDKPNQCQQKGGKCPNAAEKEDDTIDQGNPCRQNTEPVREGAHHKGRSKEQHPR